MTTKNLPSNPFVGLRPFYSNEDMLFFGREQEIGDFFNLFKKKKLIAIVGDSGVGKTSFVQAGLVPRLLSGGKKSKKNTWLVIRSEPGRDFFENITRSLVGSFGNPDLNKFENLKRQIKETGTKAIVEYIRTNLSSPNQNLLLFIDHFEQLFYRPDEKTPEEFSSNLNRICSMIRELMEEGEINLKLVITICSDFLNDVSNHTVLGEEISKNLFHLALPSSNAVKRIITEPLKLYDIDIENQLIELLTNEFGKEKCTLSLLQHVLYRLIDVFWESEGQILSQRLYEKVGGYANSVNLYADRIFGKLTILEKQTTKNLFEQFVAIDDAGRILSFPLSLREVEEQYSSQNRKLAQLIDLFYSGGYAFLLYEEDQIRNDIYIALSHVCLTSIWDMYSHWLEEKFNEKLFLQSLVTAARQFERGEATPLTGITLQQAIIWRDKLGTDIDRIKKIIPDLDKVIDYVNQCEAVSKLTKFGSHKRLYKSRWFRLFGITFLTVILLAIFPYLIIRHYSSKPAKIEKSQEISIFENGSGGDKKDIVPGEAPVDSVDSRDTGLVSTPANKNDLQAVRSTPEFKEKVTVESSVSRLDSSVLEKFVPEVAETIGKAKEAENLAEKYRSFASQALQYDDWLSALHFYSRALQLETESNQITLLKNNILNLLQNLYLTAQFKSKYIINGVTFSNSGQYVVSWEADNTARIWSVESNSLFCDTIKHPGAIWGAIFNSNDKILLTWSEKNDLRLWNVLKGTQLLRPLEHDDTIYGVKISTNGRKILSWSFDGVVKIWNTLTGDLIGEPQKYPASIKSASFNHLEDKVLIQCLDGSIWIYDPALGGNLGEKLTLQAPNEEIKNVLYSQNDRWLLVLTEKRLYLWDVVNDYKLKFVVENDYGLLKNALFSDDERYVVYWDEYRYATILNILNQRKIGQSLYHDAPVLGAFTNADHVTFCTYSKDAAIRKWRFSDGSLLSTTQFKDGYIETLVLSPDKTQLFCNFANGDSRLLSTAGFNVKSFRLLHRGKIETAMFNANGEELLTFSRDDNVIKIWNLRGSNLSDLAVRNLLEKLSPAEYILMIEVLTGTTMDDQGILTILSYEQWKNKKLNIAEIEPILLKVSGLFGMTRNQ